jgi:hypothetical protein
MTWQDGWAALEDTILQHCAAQKTGQLGRQARGLMKARPFPQDECIFFTSSSSVVHVPGVNDIQSSSSTGQSMSQISRQLNQSQVAWTGSRPPFPGQVWAASGCQSSREPTMCFLLDPSSEGGWCSWLEWNLNNSWLLRSTPTLRSL